jgi:hypothetical protein
MNQMHARYVGSFLCVSALALAWTLSAAGSTPEPVVSTPPTEPLRMREQASEVVTTHWFLAGLKPQDYSWSNEESDAGQRVIALQHRTIPVKKGFGTLMQNFNAEKYCGKRVRFSATVSSESVREWAGLWMRVDPARGVGPYPEPLAFDNMGTRPIVGTTGRRHYAVVLDVPPAARQIALGILLEGGGAVSMSNPELEVVGLDVPTTQPR